MKKLAIIFLFFTSVANAQLSIDSAKEFIYKYQIGSYSYHEQFSGHRGYAAPVILTDDGGAAGFGDFEDNSGRCALLVKLDSTGAEVWKKTIRAQYDELESQSVIEDSAGNIYVFMLSYDYKKYRGGAQRIICYDKLGNLLWDKTIGEYNTVNNPTISYIHLQKDGRLALRGHKVIEKPKGDDDPQYLFWEGWMNSKGELTQQTGKVIDWASKEWQEWFKPDLSRNDHLVIEIPHQFQLQFCHIGIFGAGIQKNEFAGQSG
jgi:hypothetical protein